MGDYVITVLFDDSPETVLIELAGPELDWAESFTAQLRSDVEHAKTLDAPVLEVEVPDSHGTSLTIDPRHVRSIDLEPAE